MPAEEPPVPPQVVMKKTTEGHVGLIPERHRITWWSMIKYMARCLLEMGTGKWVLKGMMSTLRDPQEVYERLQAQWATVSSSSSSSSSRRRSWWGRVRMAITYIEAMGSSSCVCLACWSWHHQGAISTSKSDE